MTSQWDEELRVAIEAVRQASAACRSVQAGITPEALAKKDKSPVTVADFASQAVICRALADAFPDDAVIAEEDSAELRSGEAAPFRQRVAEAVATTGILATPDAVCDWIDRGRTSDSPKRFWTLDPIDGTKGFLRREQYAVSLALIVDGQIQIGILGCPNLPVGPGNSKRGMLFAAGRGEGAQAIPLDGGDAARIHVRNTADIRQAVLCESVESGHSDHSASARITAALGLTAPPIRMDSQAKYATVARGEADIYLRLPTRADYREMIWDHAGGVLVVEEAGGHVTDVDGRTLEWTHGRTLAANRGVVVAPPQLHEAVRKAVSAALAPLA